MNATDLELRDAVVVDVQRGGRAPGDLPRHDRPGRRPWTSAPSSKPEDAAPRGTFDPQPFLDALRSYHEDRPENSGEIRLVAWAPRPLGGQKIEPVVDRHRGFTAVVVHLKLGPPPSPDGPDVLTLAGKAEPETSQRSARLMTRRRSRAGADARPGKRPNNPSTPPAGATPRPLGDGPDMIEVINFTKRYGDFVAVDDLSFTIGKGEVFGFIGPNGAGKSTTIRFLATLLRPTSGEGRDRRPLGRRRPDGRAPGDRLHARRLRRLRRHEGLGVPRLLRRRLRDPPRLPQEDHRRGARAARPDAQARRLRQRPVARG